MCAIGWAPCSQPCGEGCYDWSNRVASVNGTSNLEVVQPHGFSPVSDRVASCYGRGRSGSQPLEGASHARPGGPSPSSSPRWDINS